MLCTTVLLTTHYMAEAEDLADRIAIMLLPDGGNLRVEHPQAAAADVPAHGALAVGVEAARVQDARTRLGSVGALPGGASAAASPLTQA